VRSRPRGPRDRHGRHAPQHLRALQVPASRGQGAHGGSGGLHHWPRLLLGLRGRAHPGAAVRQRRRARRLRRPQRRLRDGGERSQRAALRPPPRQPSAALHSLDTPFFGLFFASTLFAARPHHPTHYYTRHTSSHFTPFTSPHPPPARPPSRPRRRLSPRPLPAAPPPFCRRSWWPGATWPQCSRILGGSHPGGPPLRTPWRRRRCSSRRRSRRRWRRPPTPWPRRAGAAPTGRGPTWSGRGGAKSARCGLRLLGRRAVLCAACAHAAGGGFHLSGGNICHLKHIKAHPSCY
jgi:hypothetical protein